MENGNGHNVNGHNGNSHNGSQPDKIAGHELKVLRRLEEYKERHLEASHTKDTDDIHGNRLKIAYRQFTGFLKGINDQVLNKISGKSEIEELNADMKREIQNREQARQAEKKRTLVKIYENGNEQTKRGVRVKLNKNQATAHGL